AKVFLPLQIALEIVAVETARAVVDVEPLAVGEGRLRGKRVVRLMTFVRHFAPRGFLPEHFSRRAVEREHRELVHLGRLRAGAETGRPAPLGPGRRVRGETGDGSGDEQEGDFHWGKKDGRGTSDEVAARLPSTDIMDEPSLAKPQ